MHVMLSTLYPQHLGDRREDQNTLDILTQYRAAPGDVRLSLFAGSAHPAAVDHMRRLLGGLGVEHEIARVPYEYSPHHDSRRAHEIGFGKQWLTQQWRGRDFDVVAYLDADVYVSWADLVHCVGLIETPATVVRIPYVLRDMDRAPAESFGAFAHSRHALMTMDYSRSVYATATRCGKLIRTDAPDCLIQRALLRRGAKKVRATEIETRHYTAADRYGRWWRGRISRHAEMGGLVGFNPEISGAALDAASVLVLHAFCRGRRIRTAINLGTGTGNSLLAMLQAGVERVATIDHAERYTDYCRRMVPCVCGADRADRVEYLTRRTQPGGAYDLSGIAGPRVDLVLVAGPAHDPGGRLESAMQLEARYYLFHDAARDRRMIREFAERLAAAGRLAGCEHVGLGRGIAIVEARE